MKKIMTIMASLATTLFAFGALGDVSAPPAGFEGEDYTSGSRFNPGVEEGGSTYWYAAAVDDTNIITNYADSGTSVPGLVTGVVRPDGMKENDAYPSNSNFLSLETSTPLFRSVQANNQDGEFTGSTIGDGIYLDTLVKFTASEEEFKDGALEANVDKIAIEYVDQTTDETIQNPIKTFVIRAGYIGSSLFQTNYYAYLPADKTFQNFDINAWHRLTVRTMANIGGNNVGFIVYLDQKPLAYDGDCGDNFSPSTDAQNYYNNEIHAVYPSAVGSGTGKNTIAAVAFSGTGAIDDVVFTTETPEFITASESVVVPFVADAGVTAISVEVDDDVVTNIAVTAAGTYAATLEAQTTAFTVNVTVDEANGYTLGGISYNGDPVVNGEVTGYAGGDITITTVRNNFNLFDENGDPIQGTFQKLSEVLETEGVAKIVLAHSYNVAENEGNEFVTYNIDSDITLNLNGNTITAVDTQEEVLFTVNAGTTLVVIDSVGGGTIDYDTEYGVFGGEGDTVVGATSGDFGPTIIGPLLDTEEDPFVQVVRAKLDGEGNSDTEDSFAFKDYIAKGSDVSDELVGGYWVVTPQGGSEPTEIAVPTAKTGLVYDGTEKTGVEAGTGYMLTGATATNAGDYTAIATPASGYAWVGGSTDATNITWSIAKAQVTATVSLSVTEATYDSEKDEVTDYTSPSVNFGLGAPELVENTDYTVAWSATAVTGAGTFTYTVSPVAGSNYTFTEASVTLTITAGDEYPSYIDPTDTDAKAKYDSWSAYAGVTPAAAAELEDAFLLNCLPAEVGAAKAAFKITSISYDTTQEKWVVTYTDGYNERKYNGTVTVKQYSDVGCKTESSTGTFFRATLD